MQILKVELTKRRLAAIPAEERRALLLLGHAVNEINVLQKLMMMVRKDDAPHRIVDLVEAGQILIFMRILIGKLHEAWELFKVRVQGEALLRSKYLDNLTPERRILLDKLNRHFGNKSPLTAIRNQVSLHYKDETNLVEANFQHVSETEPWEFYLSEIVANSFYYASELVTTASTIKLANPDSHGEREAFNQLFNLMLDIAGDIVELFQQLIADMVEPMDVEAVGVEIGDAAKMSTSNLPFFFDEDDLRCLSGREVTVSLRSRTGH